MNLHALRKLDTAISTKINSGAPNSAMLTLSIYDQNLAATYNKKKSEALDEKTTIIRLIQIRTNIRDAVQEANHASGINKLISRKKHLELVRAQYLNISGYKGEMLQSDVQGQISAKIEMTKGTTEGGNTFYSKPTVKDTINMPVYTEEDVNTYKLTVKSLDKEIRAVDGRLLSLNMSYDVDPLSPEDIQFLEEEGFI